MESTSYKTVYKTDQASVMQTDNNLIKPVIYSQTYKEELGWWWVLADRVKRERSRIRKKIMKQTLWGLVRLIRYTVRGKKKDHHGLLSSFWVPRCLVWILYLIFWPVNFGLSNLSNIENTQYMSNFAPCMWAPLKFQQLLLKQIFFETWFFDSDFNN